MAVKQGLSRWRRSLNNTAWYLPEINFILVHYGYFICTILAASVIFWGSSTPSRSISFTDSLFVCTSAMTEAGRNTVNLLELNAFQQLILFFLILVGSAIFVSIFVLLVRLRAFHRHFHHSSRERRELREKGHETRKRSRSLLRRDPEGTDSISAPMSADALRNSGDAGIEIQRRNAQGSGESTGLEHDSRQSHLMQSRAESTESDMQSGIDIRTEHAANERHSQGIRFDHSPNYRSGEREQSEPSLAQNLHSLRIESRPSIGSRNAGNVPERMRRPFLNFSGVGATPSLGLRARSASLMSDSYRSEAFDNQSRGPAVSSASIKGLSTEPWFKSAAGFFSRNSAAHNLSMQERQQLGGCEYSAVRVLSMIVPLYYALWLLLGTIACGAWVQSNRPDTARTNGLNPFWVGSFNAASAFNNSGMSLLDANMTAFQDSYFLVLSMGLFILAGNTAYPIFLRIIIWAMHKLLPNDEAWTHDKDTLSFLLKHPRRCYTNLLPSAHTWWLGASLVALNGIDWAGFEILNLGNSEITKPLSTKIEVLDGLFQALAVRSGGFYVVTISDTRIALRCLYVGMMYISAYPVAITMRNSNVYEERSLCIYEEDLEDAEDIYSRLQRSFTGNGDSAEHGFLGQVKRFARSATQAQFRQASTHFVRQQLRAQLSHDAWWICLAVFLIMIVEGGRFESDPIVFSCFNVIFEVVSAYGCVGISVGVPWAAFSFSGAWHGLSKLILVAVMIRGRHRGLPVAIDHAVNLPGRQMWMAEEEDGKKKLERSWTMREGQV